MALNITTIQPAILKAKNVATEQYVDTAVDSIDISQTLNANNNVFAQRLGYISYADMVAAAESGQTVINGGYIRGELIEANSINAGQIDAYAITGKHITGGTIDGTDITGVRITGSTITGARINGAIIKASYLDLDGDLEVLTNYHISVSMYNSNPGLYTDAVFISADNEYRIPSISVVKELNTGYSNGIVYGTVRSYNTANAGHNLKAAKPRPYFQNIAGNPLATNVDSAILRVGGVVVGTFSSSMSNPSSNSVNGGFRFTSNYTSGFYTGFFVGDNMTSEPEVLFRHEEFITNVPAFGDLSVEMLVYGNYVDGGLNHWRVFNIYTGGGGGELPFDWTDTNARISIQGSNVRIAGIQINNMI